METFTNSVVSVIFHSGKIFGVGEKQFVKSLYPLDGPQCNSATMGIKKIAEIFIFKNKVRVRTNKQIDILQLTLLFSNPTPVFYSISVQNFQGV